MLIDELPIDDVNPNNLDEYAKSGGLIPVGKYHARLDNVRDANANSGNVGQEFVFTILTGAFAGKEVKDTLWGGDKEGAKNRQIIFASRLGLLKRNGNKFERVPGKGTFYDAIGAEVILDVVHEKYERKDGKEGTACRLSYAGVIALDDPAVRNVARAKPVAAGKPGEAAPAKKSTVAEL